MLSEFTEALRHCPWYNKIFEKYPVVMLYITGSQLYGVTDERSDYDLVAICDVDDITECEPNLYLMWRGKKVHWTWLPLRLYTECPTTNTALQDIGLSQFCRIRDEVIVYRNPDYEETITALIANKDSICQLGTEHFANHFRRYIDEICEQGHIDEQHYSKFISHLCRAYFDLTNQPYDEDFLRSIKRIRWQPVSDEYKDQAVQCLKGLRKVLGWVG